LIFVGIDDHLYLEVIVRFVDICGIDDHLYLEVIVIITSKQRRSSIPTNINKANNRL
jgi:hypothetical protein